MYYIVILLIVAADQLVKKLVASSMAIHQTIPVIENIFHLTYIQNTGAAFSLFSGFRTVLVLLPVVMIVAALFYLVKKRKTASPFLLLSLAFIVGGGLGNVIDRIVYGYVVDYFDFRVFPIFNIADIFVCLGCALLLIYVVFIDGKGSHAKG